jgi:succinyl-CoA:acetate CoA-transferase
MRALDGVDFGDREVVYYGEVIQDGLLDMIDAGAIESASATSLALSLDAQDRLFDEVDRYAEDIVLRPADVTNNPGVISRMGLVAVNSALEIDIYGHVNSTHVTDSRILNGLGGSGDFNRNAFLTVVAMPSVAKDGDVSRIVPMTHHVDHTEHDIDVVVTEQGVADLRGLSPRERAVVIVAECAHPSHRDALEGYRENATRSGGHSPHDRPEVLNWGP